MWAGTGCLFETTGNLDMMENDVPVPTRVCVFVCVCVCVCVCVFGKVAFLYLIIF